MKNFSIAVIEGDGIGPEIVKEAIKVIEKAIAKYDTTITWTPVLAGGCAIGAVIAKVEVADAFQSGDHGSTFGGNPLACAVALAALEVVEEEKLSEKAEKLGKIFRAEINKLIAKTDLIYQVRGKGLLNAILVNDSPHSPTAWNMCIALK